MPDPVVIVAAARTPIGSFQGVFSTLSATELGGFGISAVMQQSGLQDASLVSEVMMGCVLSAGLGQAPARQAAFNAGLPESVPATTLNKMCGSGLKTIALAADLLAANPEGIYIAGGMESMTNAPYLLPKARQGHRMGHTQVYDHMFLDGLEDAYERGTPMGIYAEKTASEYGFTRQAQDEFALTSLQRAQSAIATGQLAEEVVPVTVKTRRETIEVTTDETPGSVRVEKISSLKPAFVPEGTVTAANSSSISDGAAAVMLMRESRAMRLGLKPLARVIGHASHAQAPECFTTAPVGAIRNCLDQVHWDAGDVDRFEINEAFAVVTMAAMQELKLEHDKVNVFGGACALGHPIGASGARILVTLLSALRQAELKRGVASLCIGGGEAVAMAVELV